jgi:uncharacterized MAPEG superfamily protein
MGSDAGKLNKAAEKRQQTIEFLFIHVHILFLFSFSGGKTHLRSYMFIMSLMMAASEGQ